MSKPICYDGYCGLGGWSEGFLAEGYRCVGFDIEAHDYGTGGYPGELILRDMRQVHGSELKDAACLVFSPPCQKYSYMAMPWSRSKQMARALQGKDEFPEGYSGSRTVEQLNELFNTCFRIQHEACEAAGHYIPMVIENVRGAQKWVGRAKAHYGSFFLWGDVGMVGNRVVAIVNGKILGRGVAPKHPREDFGWNHCEELQSARREGVKFSQSGDAWFDGTPRDKMLGDKGPAAYGSKSNSRKAASALIAKIPFALSQYIAQSFKPEEA